MYKTISFKRKILTTAIAAVSFSGMAYAQDDSVEEVMVTGIRASVAQAMDTKRNAVGVVDAISAEDIGKMPDTNLAESLQRITGLSINRSDGEGSQVTARGIGAELNMVTLNGRVMPAVSNGNTGDSSTRAYDFANLASESVAGVEVYKTGRADVATGGLGATINIKTLRPLEAGSRATIGVKATQDETVRSGAGDEITPEVSGLASWANDDDTFGVALTGSYQRRDSSNANNFVNNWANINKWDSTNVDVTKRSVERFKDGVVINNAPAEGQLYALPTDLRYEVQDNKRERTNAQAVIQFKPTERLTATLDYTYSELDRTSERAQQSVWFNTDAISELTFDNGAVRTPIIYRESYLTEGVSRLKDVSFAAGHVDSLTQNNSIGFNFAYEVNDQFNVALDYHNSSANNNSTGVEVGLNANTITSEYVDWSKDMPLMSITTDDCILRERPPRDDYYSGNCNGIVDGGDVSGAMTNNPRSITRTEIEQTQLLGDYQFNGSGFFENAGVKFGFEQRQDVNTSRASGDNRQGVGNWDGIDPTAYPDQYFESRDFGKDFPDYGSTTNNSLFFVGVDANLPKIIETAEAINASGKYPSDFYGFVNGKVQWNGIYTTNREIEEESQAAFVQFNSNFELGGLDSNLVVGLRYEETDVTSSSLVNAPEILWWESDNDWSVVYADEKTQQRETGSYDYLLPNIDFDISPIDSLKLRLSYSETIGRPGYSDLRPDVGLNDLLNRTANSGDAALKPMESQNVDVSAEWYYTEDSYLSLGYFRKDVDGFIGTQIFDETAYGLRDVRLGQTAIASGIPQVNEEQLHDYVLANSDAAYITNTKWVRADGDDPLLNWKVNKPVNDKSTVIDGIEAAVQHWFGQSGFGVQANYTMVDSDVEFDNLSTEGQFAMTGLSDTANLVGFYDRDAWEIRLAYNWRDSFLESRTAGGGNQPEYVEEYSQIDVSIGYDISENLTLTAEGLNVTGENYRTHGRSEAQLLSLEDLGARYQLGLRYTF